MKAKGPARIRAGPSASPGLWRPPRPFREMAGDNPDGDREEHDRAKRKKQSHCHEPSNSKTAPYPHNTTPTTRLIAAPATLAELTPLSWGRSRPNPWNTTTSTPASRRDSPSITAALFMTSLCRVGFANNGCQVSNADQQVSNRVNAKGPARFGLALAPS